MTDANAVAGTQPKNNQNASVYKEYDELNRPTLSRDAANGDTRYTYDLLGNVTSITDALGQVTTFVYDDLGRLIETVDPVAESPDKTDRVLMYDEAGNVLLTEDRTGRQTRCTYDALNRLILTEYLLDGSQDSFVYDGFGDLVEAANNDVTYTYSYTPRHELQGKTDSRLGKTLAWTYDAVGNIATKTDYQNETTEYQYDSANRLVAERNPAYLQVSYHYDGAGRLLDRILSNGAKTAYTYDDDNRLTGLKNISADGTVVEDLAYLRDNVGNITRFSDSVSGRTATYSYDRLYRLKGVYSTDDNEDRYYTYDYVGNRKSVWENSTVLQNRKTYYYAYGAGNRLTTIRTDTPTSGPIYRQFTYDAAGRILEKQTGDGSPIYTVTYNGKGRAEEIVNYGGTRHYFSYDPGDHRIEKDAKLYHLEGEHLEAVYSPGGTLEEKYLRGAVVDEIVNGYHYHSADPNDWTNYTYHHDQLNSVTAMTGPAGSIEQRFSYDAFGRSLFAQLLGSGNSIQYTGREYDEETWLYYYRARYYDPEIGRFISEDPKGFEAGVNFYAYVQNNPVNFNDPMGLMDFDISAGYHLPFSPVPMAIGQSWSILDNKTPMQEEVTFNTYGDAGFAFGVSDVSNTGGKQAGETWTLGFGKYLGLNVTLRKEFDYSLPWYDLTRYIDAASLGVGVAIPSPIDVPVTMTAPIDVSAINNFNNQGTSISIPEIRNSTNGGFVLYPNKPNTNMMQAVYSK
ncbi:MAG: RHS repeat-associated core domain-containing protein [Thermodesulfobacteriota bacterium]